LRIGIDLGGSKIEGIALADDGGVGARLRIAAPQGDYGAIVAAIVGLIGKLEAMAGQPGNVGVGIPGTLSPASGRVKNANSTWLIGQALDRDLAQALGRPVRLANDANCFALSEASDGAGRGAAAVFGVIVGTGTGGGLVVDGRVLEGRNRIAGEWGHNPLPWPEPAELPGPLCYCGKRGCIETFLSGSGLAREHGGAATAHGVAAAAAAGEPSAVASLERYCRRMAKALATVINLFDPEIIVLGGGLSNIAGLYRRVPELWGEYVFSDRVDTSLLPACHGDASGVRGAAWLWPKGRR